MKPSRAERKAFELTVRKVRYVDLVKAPHRYQNWAVHLWGPIRWIREYENGVTEIVFQNSEPSIIGPGNDGDFFAVLRGYTDSVNGDFAQVCGWLDGWNDQWHLPALRAKWVYSTAR
jgi:hypothetical protein